MGNQVDLSSYCHPTLCLLTSAHHVHFTNLARREVCRACARRFAGVGARRSHIGWVWHRNGNNGVRPLDGLIFVPFLRLATPLLWWLCVHRCPIPCTKHLSTRASSSRTLPPIWVPFHWRGMTAIRPCGCGGNSSVRIFQVLGTTAIQGRVFGPDETKRGIQPVAVISARIWREQFSASAQVVGQTIRLNGRLVTIIGVAASQFQGASPLMSSADIWMPVTVDPTFAPELANNILEDKKQTSFAIIGRLVRESSVRKPKLSWTRF